MDHFPLTRTPSQSISAAASGGSLSPNHGRSKSSSFSVPAGQRVSLIATHSRGTSFGPKNQPPLIMASVGTPGFTPLSVINEPMAAVANATAAAAKADAIATAAILSERKRQVLFSNIVLIRDLNQRFLNDLEARLEKWTDVIMHRHLMEHINDICIVMSLS
jgi:hypothetical protein